MPINGNRFFVSSLEIHSGAAENSLQNPLLPSFARLSRTKPAINKCATPFYFERDVQCPMRKLSLASKSARNNNNKIIVNQNVDETFSRKRA